MLRYSKMIIFNKNCAKKFSVVTRLCVTLIITLRKIRVAYTHVTIQNRDVVAVIGASVKCAATHGSIGRLFEMQILRLSSYISSCFVINVHAHTYALAEPAKHAANLSVNGDNCERMHVPIESVPSNINSLFS